LQNLFTNTKSWLTEAGIDNGVKSLSLSQESPASGLLVDLEQAQKEVEAALTNSFDTPRAMLVLLKLVNTTNAFVKNNKDVDLAHVEAIVRWITKMVGIFGLDANASPPYDGLGWASSIASDIDPKKAIQPYTEVTSTVQKEVTNLSLASDTLSILLSHDASTEFESIASGGSRDIEKLSLPYIRVVSQIRDELRRIVSSQSPETKKAILAITDRIRDVDLTNLGVYLDDRPDNQPSLIKFIPAAELIRAREEKAAREAEKAQKKEEARLAREKTEWLAKEKAKIPPEEMFKTDERYSAWDESGMPTKMKDGSDVPKSQQKSLKKMWEKQKKAHEEIKAKGGL
jgi:cysteinyl-tRNA synthetase